MVILRPFVGPARPDSCAPMRYPEAIQFLYDLQLHGLKLGLENTRRLAALAGNPHERLRFIHVAGTNGKGSTCAMLESVFRAAGQRVGLFTSPHLVSFGERIQVHRCPMSESEVVAGVTAMKRLLADFPGDHPPTFFEVVTVMALRHFAAAGCDLVIWETGMGGRLDATNIVTPLASVITNIAFDHERWLGHTLDQIAREKAGIIKPGVPVITGADAPEALRVIRSAAADAGADLVEVAEKDLHGPPLDQISLPLLGDHQRRNAAVAVATARRLASVLPVSAEAITTGLRNVWWPGRLQVVHGQNGQVNLVDGAHNPAGVAALVAALERHFPGQRPALIFGALEDKDWRAMCRALLPVAKSACLVPVASARAATPEQLRSACEPHPAGCPVNVCHSLAEAFRLTRAEPFRLITGSLYLVGEALELLGASASPPRPERSLNEWAGRKFEGPAPVGGP